MLTRKSLLRLIDVDAVERAIAQAEQRSSGEVRVCVSRFFWGDVRRQAERAFTRLGMTNTAARNGVLIFVVPSRKRFVVLGDEGIHARVGQAFWDGLREILGPAFAQGRYGEGLLAAIDKLGHALGEHFPAPPRDANVDELPNAVDIA